MLPKISAIAEPRYQWSVMAKKKWRDFKTIWPFPETPIMVKDHEDNLSPGVWLGFSDGEFRGFFPIPLGRLMKWTYIAVPVTIIELEDGKGRIYEYHYNDMLYENGEKIKLNKLYDFGNPVSKK